MFVQLTKYLFHYKELDIPAVGAFKLVEVPASVDVVNKLMQPPGYDVQFSEHNNVREHQLSFLATSLHCDKEAAYLELEKFGDSLKSQLNKGAFSWKGLGTLELSEGGTINFHAAPQRGQLLSPVPAERVHRDRNQQTVLIGDKEIQTGQDEYIEEAPLRKRSVILIIAWILVLLSLVFIGYHFYTKGLKPSSSGNQIKVKVDGNGG